MSKKNLIAGQSGGPTAAINSSLYGVVSEALKHTEEIDHVYGMVNGIEGFLNGTVLDFQEALPGEQLRALTWTPGAYLGSCRYKLPESLEDPVYPKLFRKFEEMNIGWFFYIGGNDSMDTVSNSSKIACNFQGIKMVFPDLHNLIKLLHSDQRDPKQCKKQHITSTDNSQKRNCDKVVCFCRSVQAT